MLSNVNDKDINYTTLEYQYWEDCWDKNVKCYVYTIGFECITAFSKCIVDYDYSDETGNIDKREQFGYIYRIETDTDYIRLYADMKPTEDIPIEFVVVDVCFR